MAEIDQNIQAHFEAIVDGKISAHYKQIGELLTQYRFDTEMLKQSVQTLESRVLELENANVILTGRIELLES